MRQLQHYANAIAVSVSYARIKQQQNSSVYISRSRAQWRANFQTVAPCGLARAVRNDDVTVSTAPKCLTWTVQHVKACIMYSVLEVELHEQLLKRTVQSSA
jgi:hypothetical protein